MGKWSARLRQGTEAVGVALFAAMFATFLLQVCFRYALNRPLGWSDELALLLYPWSVFWACAFLVPLRAHVSFDLAYAAAPLRARRLLAALAAAILVGLFLYALPATLDYVRFMGRERTPVLGWRYDVLFACFPLFLMAVAARAGLRIRALARAGWESQV